jgi:LPXTG-site transpeptidase (sortase) family protein
MVRRRRGSFASLFSLILVGMLAGIVFVIYDTVSQPSQPSREPIMPPTSPTWQSTSSEVMSTPAAITLTPLGTVSTSVSGMVSEATLFIPKAAVSAPIIPVFLDGESWDVSQLGDNVGHLQGTAWLDQPGNIVLSGHVERRNGRPGIFAALNDLSAGDEMIVMYSSIERRYRVAEVRTVEPDDLTPLYPTDSDMLTLITCDSYDFFQNTYQKRIVVTAERIS